MTETREIVFDLDSYKPDNQVSTTLAKQLALYVILYSPVQMAADLPQHYEGHPAFQFIKDVAIDWEESKVLDGEIGEYIVIARKERNGQSWFVGGLTNESARNFTVDFSFLDKNSKYEVTAYIDGKDAHWDKNPQDYEIISFEADNKFTTEIPMAPGGGFALSIKKND